MKIIITSVSLASQGLVVTTVSYRGYIHCSPMLPRQAAWAWVKEACESLVLRVSPEIVFASVWESEVSA